jgi:hypothetical protein
MPENSGFFAKLVQLVESKWVTGIGSFSLLSIAGLLDGHIYYSVFGVSFLDYADVGDLARVGFFGGLFAAVVAGLVAFAAGMLIFLASRGAFALFECVLILVGAIVRASSGATCALLTFTGRGSAPLAQQSRIWSQWQWPISARATLREMSREVHERARTTASVAFACAWLVSLGAFIVAHEELADARRRQIARSIEIPPCEDAHRQPDDPQSSAGLLTANERCSQGVFERMVAFGQTVGVRFVNEAVARTSPPADTALSVRMVDRQWLDEQPLALIGRLGPHYIFLRMQAEGRHVAALASRMQSIEPYNNQAYCARKAQDTTDLTLAGLVERLERLEREPRSVDTEVSGPLRQKAVASESDRLDFPVFFEFDGGQELSGSSREFLDHVAKTLDACRKEARLEEIQIEVQGGVSSGGIPEVKRNTDPSIHEQIRLSRSREEAIGRYFREHYPNIRVVSAPRVLAPAKAAGINGAINDRPNKYDKAIGLLNRTGWLSLRLDIAQFEDPAGDGTVRVCSRRRD